MRKRKARVILPKPIVIAILLIPLVTVTANADPIARTTWRAKPPVTDRTVAEAQSLRTGVIRPLLSDGTVRNQSDIANNIESPMQPYAPRKYLTLHHTGYSLRATTPNEKMRELQRRTQDGYTVPRNGRYLFALPGDIPYHFVVLKDGSVGEGREVRFEPFSNTTYSSPINQHVTVVLEGDFGTDIISARQRSSLLALLASLAREYDIPSANFNTHRAVAVGGSSCPGHTIIADFDNLKRELSTMLD